VEKRVLKIFIDTSYIIAIINERDQYHNQALNLANLYLDHPIVVTDSIILEIANSLSRRYKTEAIQVIEEFLSSEDVEVVRLTIDTFEQAFNLYKTRQDKEWGLVDCISFTVMKDRNISRVLTFDQHFTQAGFQMLT
jgi:uncharacterized protein